MDAVSNRQMAAVCTVVLMLSSAAVLVLGAEEDYEGVEVGALSRLHHQVSGTVFALDDKHLLIKNFNYDGTAPDAYFYVGKSGRPAGSEQGGIKITDEKGTYNILGGYRNQNLLLTLPGDLKVSQLEWISVWCKAFGVDFGNLVFPSDLNIPQPLELQGIPRGPHGTESDKVIIMDEKTILVKGFSYDDTAPGISDAYFIGGLNGLSPRPDPVNPNYITLQHDSSKDPNDEVEKLGSYSDQDVTLRLPLEVDVRDLTFLSVYCIRCSEKYASIQMPAAVIYDTNPIPAHLMQEMAVENESEMGNSWNCESLHQTFNVYWQIDPTYLTVKLVARIDADDYMSFGISGSSQNSQMGGADVAVAWLDGGTAQAMDYTISAYSACSRGAGVCPDVLTGGRGSVTVMSGARSDGITEIIYRRPINTGDSKDIPIVANAPQYIVWAIGNINEDKLPAKHTLRLDGNKRIEFGRTPTLSCQALVGGGSESGGSSPEVEWPEREIRGQNEFMMQLGPSAHDRGYKATTGRTSWGYAYYVNGLLIPRLYVQRGQTYKFTIKTGNNRLNTATYHPVYISTDEDGGYIQHTAAQKSRITVFAGISNGEPSINATGTACVWEPKDGVDRYAEFDTFVEYADTLKLTCEEPQLHHALYWTPDENTPDEVYYQCYQHKYLGWKIQVTNPSDDNEVFMRQDIIHRVSNIRRNFKPDSGAARRGASPVTSLLAALACGMVITRYLSSWRYL